MREMLLRSRASHRDVGEICSGAMPTALRRGTRSRVDGLFKACPPKGAGMARREDLALSLDHPVYLAVLRPLRGKAP